MKTMIKVFVLAAIMIAFSASTYAQRSERQRINREQLADKQAHFIAGELALDPASTKRFVETYKDYQRDIWKLGPRPERGKAALSEKETQKMMDERFARSQKILDLRKKYYSKYNKFLTPKQIERVYELEKGMMNRLHNHSKSKGKRR